MKILLGLLFFSIQILFSNSWANDPNQRNALESYIDNNHRDGSAANRDYHGFMGTRPCWVKAPAPIAQSFLPPETLYEGSDQQMRVRINGQISGYVSPGNKPDLPDNPAVPMGLQSAFVFATGDEFKISEGDGSFQCQAPVLSGQIAAQMQAEDIRIIDRHFDPADPSTFCETFEMPVAFGTGTYPQQICYKNHETRVEWSFTDFSSIPGFTQFFEGIGQLEIGNPAQQQDVASANSFYHLGRIQRNVKFSMDALGVDWTKPQVFAFTNYDEFCNAIVPFDSTTIFFGESVSGRCANASYSTIIAHEYGHVLFGSIHKIASMPWTVWQAPNFLAEYGEGMADALAAIEFNTHCMGENFFVDKVCGRDLRDPTKIFPVTDPDAHIRGMPLAAAWLELMRVLGAENNPQEIVRRLYLLTLVSNDQFMGPQLLNYVLAADCGEYQGRHLSQIRSVFGARGFIIDEWAASLRTEDCR